MKASGRTSSADRANLRQFDAYGYIPHTPAGLYHAPLTRKGECDEGSFLQLLPDRELAAKQVGPAWVLARPTRRPITSFARDIAATLPPVHRAAADGFRTRSGMSR